MSPGLHLPGRNPRAVARVESRLRIESTAATTLRCEGSHRVAPLRSVQEGLRSPRARRDETANGGPIRDAGGTGAFLRGRCSGGAGNRIQPARHRAFLESVGSSFLLDARGVPLHRAGSNPRIGHEQEIRSIQATACFVIRARQAPTDAGRPEREGFEPSVRLPAHRISSAVPSATRTPLRDTTRVRSAAVSPRRHAGPRRASCLRRVQGSSIPRRGCGVSFP